MPLFTLAMQIADIFIIFSLRATSGRRQLIAVMSLLLLHISSDYFSFAIFHYTPLFPFHRLLRFLRHFRHAQLLR